MATLHMGGRFPNSQPLCFSAKLHILTEFCSGGCLRNLLINSRVDLPESLSNHVNVTSTLNHRQLLKIAVDIASGMIHLSSHEVFTDAKIQLEH